MKQLEATTNNPNISNNNNVPQSNPMQQRTYRIKLPSNAVQGSFIQTVLPDGRTISVQVPPQFKSNKNADNFIDVIA